MGIVYADITLINGEDIGMAKRHFISEEDIRKTTVNMLVDSRSFIMCINESIQNQLQLTFIEKRFVRLADDLPREYDIVGPIHVKFKNRTSVCTAVVLEGNAEPLLGMIPMEEMDVLIDPQRQELIPKHPDWITWL
jgi:hypothetical protein